MLAQVGLSFALYVWVTVERGRGVAAKTTDYADFLLGHGEHKPAARIAANLRNQFELPVLFYAIVIFIMATREVAPAPIVMLAWAFVAGRVLHAGVQCLTDNVKLRGQVFTVNFVALVGIWAWEAFARIAA